MPRHFSRPQHFKHHTPSSVKIHMTPRDLRTLEKEKFKLEKAELRAKTAEAQRREKTAKHPPKAVYRDARDKRHHHIVRVHHEGKTHYIKRIFKDAAAERAARKEVQAQEGNTHPSIVQQLFMAYKAKKAAKAAEAAAERKEAREDAREAARYEREHPMQDKPAEKKEEVYTEKDNTPGFGFGSENESAKSEVMHTETASSSSEGGSSSDSGSSSNSSSDNGSSSGSSSSSSDDAYD